jgi:hypothetical protein
MSFWVFYMEMEGDLVTEAAFQADYIEMYSTRANHIMWYSNLMADWAVCNAALNMAWNLSNPAATIVTPWSSLAGSISTLVPNKSSMSWGRADKEGQSYTLSHPYVQNVIQTKITKPTPLPQNSHSRKRMLCSYETKLKFWVKIWLTGQWENKYRRLNIGSTCRTLSLL